MMNPADSQDIDYAGNDTLRGEIRYCAIIIRRGSKTTGGRAQCKITALGRGVTFKFLGKWEGGAAEKLL